MALKGRDLQIWDGVNFIAGKGWLLGSLSVYLSDTVLDRAFFLLSPLLPLPPSFHFLLPSFSCLLYIWKERKGGGRGLVGVGKTRAHIHSFRQYFIVLYVN